MSHRFKISGLIILLFMMGTVWGCAAHKSAMTPSNGVISSKSGSASQAVASNKPGSSKSSVPDSQLPGKGTSADALLKSAAASAVPAPGSSAAASTGSTTIVSAEIKTSPPLEEKIAPQTPQLNVPQELPPLEESDLEEDTDEKDAEEPSYDMPIVRNDNVEEYINYYQTRNRPHFELWLTRSGRYLPLMKEIFKSNGLPEDLVFLALIESGFNPNAYSRSKASGPWQFMKFTGKKYGLKITRWVDERRDPIKSTSAAARYLKDLYNLFGSWPLALASYNAGEGKVMRAMAKTKAGDFWDLSSTRYLRPETKTYVPKFMAATIIAKNPEKYGFSLEYYEPLKYDVVTVDKPTDLRVIARVTNTSYETIKVLNPELRKGMTPPQTPNYQLRIPEGTRDLFAEKFKQIPDHARILKQKHRVRRGETLAAISRKYGVPLQDLADSNNLTLQSKLRRGQTLIIPLGKADQAGENSQTPPRPDSRLGASNTGCATCEGSSFFSYRVKKGDTLFGLSKLYKIEMNAILQINDIQELKAGTSIRLPLAG